MAYSTAIFTFLERGTMHPSMCATRPIPIWQFQSKWKTPSTQPCRGNLLVTVNSNELQLVDITDPTSIKLITKFERRCTGEGLAFLDNQTLVVGSETGILLYS